ncbi:unnamed protein product [Linum tenue]|uniref:Protein LURP-one-related 8 n=1 Tax=Linum tenue TaxID=586396 RepID=A0AAV0KIF5_9ROSI|nr:unnamed protein product [Linum tenue]
MTKVYPNSASSPTATARFSNQSSSSRWSRNQLPRLSNDHRSAAADDSSSSEQVVLTVWKKSLLFNCNGFTVFDARGNLVFRVDNYMAASGNNGEILLMDAAGKPLLTSRRKRMSLTESWLVFEGETTTNPKFCVRKKAMSVLNPKCLAQVSHCGGNNNNLVYEIEGSYAQRRCTMYDSKRRIVAEIRQKEAACGGGVAFGFDVFRLIVRPDMMDTSLAMALVILLDQMFGSSRRSSLSSPT